MGDTQHRVASIGLGSMGLPIAANIAKGGYEVAGYDISPERRQLAEQQGVRAEATIAGAVKGADVIITMLYSGEIIETVLSGEDGILAHIKPGALIVDTSTISPEDSARFAKMIEDKGCRYLRAPVSGTVYLAEAGTLSVFASGNKEDYDMVQPIMEHMSMSRDYVGEGEAARVIKLVINMLVMSATNTLGEAIRFGEQWGMSREVLVDAVNNSIVGSRHYQSRAAGLKSKQYTNAGPVEMGYKDLKMVLANAEANGYDLPIHSFVGRNMQELVDNGRGQQEVSALAEYPLDDASPNVIPSFGGDECAAEIIAADDERYAVMMEGQREKIEAFYSPDLTYTHTNGYTQSKDEFLASQTSGEISYNSIDRESIEVSCYGNVALAQGTVKIDVDVAGETRKLHNRYLAVWERPHGKWRMRAWASTALESAAL